jgi:hypothetical protein
MVSNVTLMFTYHSVLERIGFGKVWVIVWTTQCIWLAVDCFRFVAGKAAM